MTGVVTPAHPYDRQRFRPDKIQRSILGIASDEKTVEGLTRVSPSPERTAGICNIVRPEIRSFSAGSSLRNARFDHTRNRTHDGTSPNRRRNVPVCRRTRDRCFCECDSEPTVVDVKANPIGIPPLPLSIAVTGNVRCLRIQVFDQGDVVFARLSSSFGAMRRLNLSEYSAGSVESESACVVGQVEKGRALPTRCRTKSICPIA